MNLSLNGTLSLKIITNELDLLNKELLLNETFEERRFFIACNQINIKTQVILVMLRNIIILI